MSAIPPFRVVIPARYDSTRLPGKPLLDIGGKPMIQHVVERAAESAASSVVVATDDERIVTALSGTPATVVMTSKDHQSGSDRVMEAVRKFSGEATDIVVNVQGDEPLIPAAVINQVAMLLAENEACGAATLFEPITRVEDAFDPNIVKVVVSKAGQALYFSRAPIPWQRGVFDLADKLTIGPGWKRHLGIYAYRIGTLERFVSLPPSWLERTESLEQLRMLENGIAIAIAESAVAVPGGIDVHADLERIRGELT